MNCGTNNIALSFLMFSYDIVNAATTIANENAHKNILNLTNKFCCRRLIIIYVYEVFVPFTLSHRLKKILFVTTWCVLSHFVRFSVRIFFFLFRSLLSVDPFFFILMWFHRPKGMRQKTTINFGMWVRWKQFNGLVLNSVYLFMHSNLKTDSFFYSSQQVFFPQYSMSPL